MKRDLNKLETPTHDILVVGGGIYGAVVFWLGAVSGLRIALIEQGDFAQATSANSQKIIHGGLRYLQTMDVPRVVQSLKERNRLMQLAPHLIHTLRCTIPVYGHGLKGKEALKTAIYVYNTISNRIYKRTKASFRLPDAEFAGKEKLFEELPGIEKRRLSGAATWSEGLCHNTERLVLSFIRSACETGAVAANYTRAETYRESINGTVIVTAKDMLSDQFLEIKSETVINCTGPWYEKTMKRIAGAREFPAQHFAAGLNLVSKKIFQSKTAFGLSNNDVERSRLFFVVPWQGRSIIGTEWFRVSRPIGDTNYTECHILKFLEQFNKVYPSADLIIDDISLVHWGFVPCRKSSGHPEEMPNILKNFQIINAGSGHRCKIISVLGVKYTTAGNVATKALKFVNPKLKVNLDPNLRLVGGKIDNFQEFKATAKRKWSERIDDLSLDRLLTNYGSDFESVIDSAIAKEALDPGKVLSNSDLLEAETLFSIRHEMAQKLCDVVFRRTGRGNAGLPSKTDLKFMAQAMSSELGWSPAETKSEIAEIKNAYPPYLQSKH